MLGRKQYQEELFSTTTLESLVPADHILKKIDKLIDFSVIYELTDKFYCHNNGRNSIDPVLFFRMQLISYLFGIKSDRRLCREIHLNIAYRWFCRLNLEDHVPHHSSMTRIRDRFGEDTFKKLFEHFIQQWFNSGIIQGKRLIADASLVEADASIDSMVERQEDDPDSKKVLPHQEKLYKLNGKEKKRKLSNQTHVSQTDPDATLVARPGYYRKLLYKVHYSIDARTRIITDCYATTGSKHECPIFPERVDIQIDKYSFPVNKVIADRGYGRGPSYSHFKSRKIRTYIPLHDKKTGEGKLTPKDFTYERENDRYKCPEGYYLYPMRN